MLQLRNAYIRGNTNSANWPLMAKVFAVSRTVICVQFNFRYRDNGDGTALKQFFCYVCNSASTVGCGGEFNKTAVQSILCDPGAVCSQIVIYNYNGLKLFTCFYLLNLCSLTLQLKISTLYRTCIKVPAISCAYQFIYGYNALNGGTLMPKFSSYGVVLHLDVYKLM